MRFLPVRLTAAAALAALPAATAEDALLRCERPAVVELETAALIVSGQQGGAIPIAAAAVPWPAGEPPFPVTVVIEIDGGGLLTGALGGEEPAGEDELDVFVYGLSRDGLEILDVVTRRLTLDWPRHREPLRTGVRMLVPLRLPAGDLLVRVLVRHGGGALGLRSAPVSVPGPAGAEPEIFPPLFPDSQPWLIAVAAGGAEIALPPPFAVGAGTLPSSLPLLVPGEIREARLLIRSPPAGGWSLRARWTPAGGGAGAETPLEIVGRAPAGGPELEAVAVSLAPPELAAGAYELAAVLVTEGTDGEVASSPARVHVKPAGATEPAALPVDAGAAAPLLSRPTPALEARYRRALRRLAAGERRAALGALCGLESSAAARLGENAPAALERAESRVFLALVEEAGAGVLPVILLHADAAREHRRRGRFDLAEHATRLTLGLAEAYAQRLATPEAMREAAWVLAGLAADFHRRGARSRAAELYSRALALRNDDGGSLHALAFLNEQSGRYDAAADLLETLVGGRPEHAEGRLRLALNLGRSGETDRAERLLRELLDRDDVPGWIALVAHQEAVRLEIDRGQLPDAADLVRRGLERWPRQPALLVLGAYLLEVRGRPKESREFLAELGSAGTPALPEEAERTRYNRWSEEALRADQRTLAERARERLDELARALPGEPAEEAGGS